ncbi:MAG TPA: VWA domain-containing protein, partial [Thermoanaerobaculia bacterium]|nr:VWA domain-containing protein [Thermoanaerobaculia bacterium]
MTSSPPPSRPPIATALLLCLLATAAVLPRAAGSQPEATEARLLVELVDERGRPIRDLEAGDLEVRVGGHSVAVSSLGPARPERIALLFDLPLLSTAQVVEAAGVLAERSARLAELAPVAVLVAERDARTVLRSSADPEALAQALGGVGVRYGGGDAVGQVRRELLEELAATAGSALGRVPPEVAERAAEAALEAIAAEADLLRNQRERLVAWAAETAPGGAGAARGAAGALVLVTGGFDEDPLAFYRAALEAYGLEGAAAGLERPVILPSLAEVARVLAAYGWLAFPYVPGGEAGAAGVPPPSEPIRDSLPRPGANPTDADDPQRPALITPRLGRRERDRSEGPQPPPVRAGREAPGALAAATGGELVGDPLQLADLLARLDRRWALSFPVAPGEPREVEVRAAARGRAAGATLRASQWVGTVPPGSVAAMRVRRVLDGRLEEGGGLPVEAAFEAARAGVGEGRLTVRVGSPSVRLEGPEGAPEAGATGQTGTSLRATVGVAREGRDPLVFHQIVERPGDPAEDESLLQLPVTLPAGAESRVAVLVEELSTGRWGAAFASHVEASPEAAGAEAEAALPDLLPSPRVVRLLEPREPFVMRRTQISAVVSDPRVERVDFYLDGERKVTRAQAPYRAALDFGDLPRPHRVEAVAFDAAGEVLGRDLLWVNQGSGGFRVRIVEPVPAETGSREAPRVGPLDVAAEVTAPPDARVDRVDFYWNAKLVASRFAPPFRQRVIVPEGAPQGFVRVVARLADGSLAEDVRFMNSPGTAERLDVNLVEMYVVATDREGRPVPGLGPADFRVYEQGRTREIATFSDARGLPLTVGLAIDSSASMFIKLPAVGLAAAGFVLDSLEDGDRAFVVGFGGEPQLAQETTADAPRLVRAIAGLRADGQTAIWESIVYSLVQLQGAPGKKALVVYTDGADEDDDFSYRTTLRFAREVGV